jgi:hypothetical protein
MPSALYAGGQHVAQSASEHAERPRTNESGLTDDSDALEDLLEKSHSLVGDLHLRLSGPDEETHEPGLEWRAKEENGESDEGRRAEQDEQNHETDDDLDRLEPELAGYEKGRVYQSGRSVQ